MRWEYNRRFAEEPAQEEQPEDNDNGGYGGDEFGQEAGEEQQDDYGRRRFRGDIVGTRYSIWRLR